MFLDKIFISKAQGDTILQFSFANRKTTKNESRIVSFVNIFYLLPKKERQKTVKLADIENIFFDSSWLSLRVFAVIFSKKRALT